jgi:hypothetical protein
MPAWKHTNKKWDKAVYYEYRKYVMAKAPEFRGRKEDCADLSMIPTPTSSGQAPGPT